MTNLSTQARRDAKRAYWLANTKSPAPFQNVDLRRSEPHYSVSSTMADNRLTSNLGHGGRWVFAKRGAP